MPLVPVRPCQEDQRLLEELAVAVEIYFEAVNSLKRVKEEAGMLTAYEFAAEAREACEAARKALKHHRYEHGCRTIPRANLDHALRRKK